MTDRVKIIVEDEYYADLFWAHLDEQMPELAEQLRREGEATVDAATWMKITSIDGFFDGPSYAPHALRTA